MAAWALAGGATGAKPAGSFPGGDACDVPLLECGGGHRGDFRPVGNGARGLSTALAEEAVDRVMFRLQGKQFHRERVEMAIGVDACHGMDSHHALEPGDERSN